MAFRPLTPPRSAAEGQPSAETHHVADQVGQFADGKIFAGTDVDDLRRIVVLQEKTAGAGQVVDMEKLPPGRARSPDDHVARPALFCFVDFAQQGRQDVRIREIEVVPGTVKIRRHCRDEIAPELSGICLTKLDPRNLSDRVGFVRWFELTGEQGRFVNRLRRELRIDTGAAEEEEFAHAKVVRPLDQVVLNFQILQQKLYWKIAVRFDSAHFCRRDHHHRRPFLSKKPAHRVAFLQVELGPRPGHDIGVIIG